MTHRTELTEEQKDTAALWWAKKAGGSLTDAEKVELERWLDRAPGNRQAYDSLRVVWAQLEKPAERAASKSNLFGIWSFIGRWRTYAMTTAVCAVCATVWFVNPAVLVQEEADIVSGQELVKNVSLPDGSTMTLSSQSAADLDFSDKRRFVKLVRGQAFFEVQHKKDSAFIVDSPNVRVRVVGTAFNVDHWGDATKISVRDGIVEVSRKDGPVIAKLTHGQEITFRGGAWGKVKSADLDEALSWMRGQINVSRITMADLALKLEKYSDSKLIVLGSIADKTISGTFPLEDVPATLDTVAEALEGGVVTVSPWLKIIY